MVKLSVNLNKIALIRNARGGKMPDLSRMAIDAERFGAQGITVHPRPDQRHTTYQDVHDLKKIVQTEFNVEGYPSDIFMDLVCEVKPYQVTLVPDAPEAITSNAGWDTKKHLIFLKEKIERLQSHGIRTSIFTDTRLEIIEYAQKTGSDRIELYTESYAHTFHQNPSLAVKEFAQAAEFANSLGLGVNAGHDLNKDNLRFFKENVPYLQEVSIGHALVCDALYLGFENTIQLYLRCLE
jgi:pyridoxine 5-phosphate synthase